MRGSIIRQCGQALDTITKIGESRHEAKATGEIGIFAISSRHVTGQRLFPLQNYCKKNGIKDIEKLTSDNIREHLKERLEHHITKGNSLQTFRAELSAVGKLEQGLNAYSDQYRNGKNQYNWGENRKQISKLAGNFLSRTTNTYKDRAYSAPWKVVTAISNPVHRLQATIQLEAGCRAEGIGAPATGEKNKASNPMTIANWHHPTTNQPLGLVTDPITQQPAAVFWTKEKGGKVAFHFCSPQTQNAVLAHLKKHGRLEAHYKDYLKSVNLASIKANQHHTGRGTHGLRHNFAQNRFEQALRRGYSDEQAKYAVSQEMSHNRADITEAYLR